MSLPQVVSPYDDGPERVYHSTLESYHSTLEPGVQHKVEVHEESNEVKPRTVCGVPISTFLLAIALIAVIIAASIGGGIGGSIAVKNAKQLCSTTTVVQAPATSAPVTTTPTPTSDTKTTTTSSSVYMVETNALLPLGCPGLDSNPQSSTFAHQTSTFQMFCGMTYTYSRAKAILSIIVYSLHDCLQACVSFNHYADADNCTAVIFYANLTYVVPGGEANCYMATDTYGSLSAHSQGDYIVTGLLDIGS
ncbi:hypothetical protein F5Y10DRAFT_254802 [Nemania abortiva]|nr:hypothetical protein F5Y10DRAFT_254802 [Nemania abortiva]